MMTQSNRKDQGTTMQKKITAILKKMKTTDGRAL